MQEKISKIKKLCQEKKAIILAHIYQPPEIQNIVDHIGDSLNLSQKAASLGDNIKIIVFCGVYFMAETAALLSPDKKVLLPDLNAGCPMANMATRDQVRTAKRKNPEATVVCYVNSTVEVKAESDICVTSSNAVKIVQALPNKKILFIPDKSLGAYVQSQVPEKEIILWPGFCPTHHRILHEFIIRAKKEHPQALVLAHPENFESVLKEADFIGSTGQIQNYVKASTHKEFIIATENGIIYRLQKDNPDKIFHKVTELAICPNMKRITLEKVLQVLERENNQITIKKEYQQKALSAINKMLEMS